MSRGYGRVMRGVLDALSGPARLNTIELCAAVFPHWGHTELSSVRRALRALRAGGQVCCLGSDLSGSNVWCLAERRHLFGPYGELKRTVTLGELLGKRAGESWFTRALLSSR